MNTDTLKSEAQIKRELSEREPEEWLRIIKTFRGNLRTRLACLVWWDIYSMRESKHRVNHFDPFLAAPYQECCQDKLKAALLKCGYSETMATQRTTVNYATRMMIERANK
jgi:hypothetical protein